MVRQSHRPYWIVPLRMLGPRSLRERPQILCSRYVVTSYRCRRVADYMIQEVDLWLSNDICRALDHPDRPPSDLELDDLPWDPNHPGDYLILLRDESYGEIACQTGCAVDQSVGQRYAYHVGMVDSIIKDQETDCACNLSLTYAFWTSPNVKAKFATVASVPFRCCQRPTTTHSSAKLQRDYCLRAQEGPCENKRQDRQKQSRSDKRLSIWQMGRTSPGPTTRAWYRGGQTSAGGWRDLNVRHGTKGVDKSAHNRQPVPIWR